MPRPSRTRRILKWTGTAICALIAFTFVFNRWWNIRYLSHMNPLSGSTFAFSVAYGAVRCAWLHSYGLPPKGWDVNRNTSGWRPFRQRLIPYIDRQGRTGPWSNGGEIVISLWAPFVVALIPTAWLWHRDRRRVRPGCCPRCGYNLTGNTSGVCSECGAPTAKANTH